MADKNTTKIIDLKIKGDEALGTIEKLSKELEIQKNKLKELNEVAKTANGLSKDQKEDMLHCRIICHVYSSTPIGLLTNYNCLTQYPL